MTSPARPPGYDILRRAATRAGIRLGAGVTFIRDGSNILYQVNDHLVARIGRPGTTATAAREVTVAHWLAAHGIAVTNPAPGLQHPTVIDDRPVTWWALLPPHRPATPTELGHTLRALHDLPAPHGLDLPELDMFTGLDDAIHTAHVPAPDRQWLRTHLNHLRGHQATLPPGRAHRLIHGDAWQSNIAVPDHGQPILLDLEHVTIGPPEWDLVAFTADHTDFTRISTSDYHDFVHAYGHDLTTWPGHRTLVDIQELRWVASLLRKTTPAATAELQHRLSCLQGHQPKPWTWTAF